MADLAEKEVDITEVAADMFARLEPKLSVLIKTMSEMNMEPSDRAGLSILVVFRLLGVSAAFIESSTWCDEWGGDVDAIVANIGEMIAQTGREGGIIS